MSLPLFPIFQRSSYNSCTHFFLHSQVFRFVIFRRYRIQIGTRLLAALLNHIPTRPTIKCFASEKKPFSIRRDLWRKSICYKFLFLMCLARIKAVLLCLRHKLQPYQLVRVSLVVFCSCGAAQTLAFQQIYKKCACYT